MVTMNFICSNGFMHVKILWKIIMVIVRLCIPAQSNTFFEYKDTYLQQITIYAQELFLRLRTQQKYV